MKYFEITDKLDSEFHPAVPRGTNIKTPGGCKECSTIPKDGRPPAVLKVTEIPSPVSPVSFTTWGFGVIAIEFMELLGDDATACLRLGKLALADGRIVEGFRTFVGVERIILRGSEESEHRICKSCGAMIYTYVPRDAPYVTTTQVTSRRAIYEAESMVLLVDDRIRDCIGNRWSDRIVFYEVPVRDSPRDGLPARLDLWPSQEI
ncbi:MAG TPA: hypothetical protein VG826_12175 [Pirellulales bacterium]|nr:hypothetical protein [Pirellulales bacterium]